MEQVFALLTCCLNRGSDIYTQDKRLKEKAQIGAASKSFDDKDSKKSQVKNNWMVARDKASQKASIDRVQSFEEVLVLLILCLDRGSDIYTQAFLQIKNATGIDNIDELVQTFIDAEDQNFSLYSSNYNHVSVSTRLVTRVLQV